MKIKKAVAVRDPERTRRQILDAALKEFAARGFAGARVEVIARRARINKRMLYHYFGDKKKLFRAALHQKIALRVTLRDAYPDAPEDHLPAWFLATCADPEWVRLIGWESLQVSGGAVDEKSRRKIALESIAKIARQQKSGKFNSAVDPAHALLAMMSLAVFPLAFPQMTRLISGKPAGHPGFQRGYAAFLKQIAEAFRPAGIRR